MQFFKTAQMQLFVIFLDLVYNRITLILLFKTEINYVFYSVLSIFYFLEHEAR